MPPPSVSPATPTPLVSPAVSPSPCGRRAAATAPQVAPAPTRTRPDAGSSRRTPLIRRVSMIMPSVLVLSPAMLCPPDRTVTASPVRAA